MDFGLYSLIYFFHLSRLDFYGLSNFIRITGLCLVGGDVGK